MIAKCFKKLKKWTVDHIRALEDRMNNVERRLVNKEAEKEKRDGDGEGIRIRIQVIKT